MKRLFQYLFISIYLISSINIGHSQEAEFVVEDISIVGLDKVEVSTVLAFVGFEKGDTIDDETLAATVARLFESGLFRDVEIMRDGNVVTITIIENPIINAIRFEGLIDLDQDQVLDLLKGQGIGEGRIYKRGNNEFIEKAVRTFYRQTSRYLASASVVTVPLEDGKIDLVVEISEGPQATIQEINFYGNQAFATADLEELFELKAAGLIDSFFDRDIFSQQTLTGDIDRVRRAYLNAGYIRVDIVSTDIRVNPIEGAIIIDIFIDEGAQYKFGETSFVIAGYTVSEEQALALKTYQEGEVFSDRLVESYRESIRRLFRQEGFAFATVDAEPTINDDTLQVDILYVLNDDTLAEVRNINFIGNNLTQDLVLRRQLEIVEGEPFNIDKLEHSLTRLRRSGYLRSVSSKEERVGDDQIDIEIEVVEDSQGTFIVGAGYSNADGVSFGLDFARNNIFGTGNDFSLDLDFKKGSNSLDVGFREPGITDSGITRNLNIYARTNTDSSSAANNISDLGGRLVYTIPINREWSWNAGLVVEQSKIDDYDKLTVTTAIAVKHDYVTKYGEKQESVRFVSGIGYDSRDTAFDTTEGFLFNTNIETSIPPSDTQYYIGSMSGNYYAPLDESRNNIFSGDFLIRTASEFGDNIFPYYKRFYLSSTQLRGFKASKIGPREGNTEIGGKVAINGSFEFIRAVKLFGVEGVRIGLFLDSAGLWNDFEEFSDNTDLFRASGGALLKIRTPVFPLSFSYGYPISKQDADELQRFQFNIGF